MKHRTHVSRVDAWHWRARCTCGYKSKHWESRDAAERVLVDHLARVRRATQRDTVMAPHVTNVSPWRFV